MTEEQLNKEWLIRELKGFSYSNELLDKILELLSEQYINGLEQSRFDKRMLEFENQELKRELNEKITSEMKLKDDLDKQRKEYQETYKDVREEIKEYKNQQKEFIEYLEDYIEVLKSQQDSVEGLDLAEEHMLMPLEEVLSKYKEIIGVNGD